MTLTLAGPEAAAAKLLSPVLSEPDPADRVTVNVAQEVPVSRSPPG